MIQQNGTTDTLIEENRSLHQRVAVLEHERHTIQQMVHSAPVFLYVFDLVEQRTIFANSGLADLLGYTDTTVVMPLIGTIDSGRAKQVMETLLDGVARQQADLVILDITGVAVVDTQVAQAFVQAAQAVRLLGSQVMLTGIQPQIAQTLVHLGVDLHGIITQSSLQAGIAYALREQHRR